LNYLDVHHAILALGQAGLLGAALALVGSSNAQVTTNGGSGHALLSTAIAALYGAGTATSPTVITLDQANPQNAPAGGLPSPLRVMPRTRLRVAGTQSRCSGHAREGEGCPELRVRLRGVVARELGPAVQGIAEGASLITSGGAHYGQVRQMLIYRHA